MWSSIYLLSHISTGGFVYTGLWPCPTPLAIVFFTFCFYLLKRRFVLFACAAFCMDPRPKNNSCPKTAVCRRFSTAEKEHKKHSNKQKKTKIVIAVDGRLVVPRHAKRAGVVFYHPFQRSTDVPSLYPCTIHTEIIVA